MNMMRSDFSELQLDAKLIDSSKVIDGYIYLSDEIAHEKLLKKRRDRRLNILFVLLLVSSSVFVWHYQILEPLIPVKYENLEAFHPAPALGEVLSDTVVETPAALLLTGNHSASTDFQHAVPEEIARFIDAELLVSVPQKANGNVRLEEVIPDVNAEINVNKVLASGNRLFARDRLMSPPGENAFVRYEQVLSIEPGNTEALQGIKNIVDRYVYLAESVIAKNESYKVPILVKSAYRAGEKYMDVSTIIQRFSTYLSDDSLFSDESDESQNAHVIADDAVQYDDQEMAYQQRDSIFIADQKVSQAAIALYETGQQPASKQMLQNFTRLSGFWGESNDLLLKIYLSNHQYAKAENLIYESKALDTHQFTEKAARIIMARGDNQGALNMLSAHRPDFSDNKAYYLLLASLQYKVGDFEQSAYWYKQLLNVDYQNPRLWLGLAVSLDSLNQVDDALQAFSYARLYADSQSSIERYINERQLALVEY
ncbi:tetratricopeptide repeat protein [Eionea flava]